MKIIKRLNPFKFKKRTKGAISLFMAVLLTPFLTVAMILVETGRYNSGVSIVDEAMGVSSVSVLSNYDTYLHDRWGLLALSQNADELSDVNALFVNSLKTNTGVLGESLTLNAASAKGINPLSDSEVLYNQVMEYCKLNAPLTLSTNLINLSDIISKLESFKNIGNILSTITSGITAVDSAITVAKSAEKLKDYAKEIERLEGEYSSNYSTFESSVNGLISALQEEKPEDEEEAKEYENNIKNLRESASNAQKQYSTTLSDLSNNMTSFKSEIETCNSAIEKVGTSIFDFAKSTAEVSINSSKTSEELKKTNEKIKELEKNSSSKTSTELSNLYKQQTELEATLAQSKTQESVLSAESDGLTSVKNDWDENMSSYSDATMGEAIKGINSLKDKVDSFSVGSVSKSSPEITPEQYKTITIAGYVSSADIEKYLQAQKDKLANNNALSLIKGVINFIKSIFKKSVFFDPALSGNINLSFYEEEFGGLPGEETDGGVIAIVSAIGSLIEDSNKLALDLVTFNLVDALIKIKEIIEDISDFIVSVTNFCIDIGKNITELFTGYDRLYYSAYTAFNLPCRTDYKNDALGFSTMTGYSLTSDSVPNKGVNQTGLTPLDGILSIIETIQAKILGGDDYTFSGAELEYVLYGSYNEISNQLYTFISIYLMRFLLDIIPVCTNSEVQTMAGSAGPFAPVVYIVELIAEPLIDTILLVNGADVPLILAPVYLTPSKFPDLIEQLITICNFTTDEKDSITSGLQSAFEKKEKAGSSKTLSFLNLSYREYCYLLLLITVTKEQQMGRISNLIQMETYYYYNKNNKPKFDLKKSYTYIQSTANVTVKQMLPSLTNSSVFTLERKLYRGY